MPWSLENTLMLTFTEPVVLRDVLGPALANASVCWTKNTSFILHLKTQTVKITLWKSFLSMDWGKKNFCQTLEKVEDKT